MEPWRFDLEQIRKNWQRDADLPSKELLARFAQVSAPLDPYAEVDGLLSRVRSLAGAELAAHEAVLAPFFDACAELMQLLAPAPEALDAGRPEGEQHDREALRAKLYRALGDLEEMLALFSGIGR